MRWSTARPSSKLTREPYNVIPIVYRYSRPIALVAAAQAAGFLPPSDRPSDAPEVVLPPPPKKTTKIVSNKSNKWVKKGRKFRDQDPYGNKDDDLID